MNQPLPKPTETPALREAVRTARPHLRVIEGGRGAAAARGGTTVATRAGTVVLGSALAAVGTFFTVLLWSTPVGDATYDPNNDPYMPDEPYKPEAPLIPPACLQGCVSASGEDGSAAEGTDGAAASDARRYGDSQTCDNETLDRLQAGKTALNDELSKNPMTPRKPNLSNLRMIAKQVPCSVLKKRLEIQERMLRKRWEIQDACFGGNPDPRHVDAIKQAEGMIANTKRYIEQNCAPSHGMSKL